MFPSTPGLELEVRIFMKQDRPWREIKVFFRQAAEIWQQKCENLTQIHLVVCNLSVQQKNPFQTVRWDFK